MRPTNHSANRALLALAATLSAHAVIAQVEQPDKYTWLEDVYSKKSLDWVRAHDAASAKILEGDPRFSKLYADALRIAESPDRLPSPDFEGGAIYNTWQDAKHVRGIFRRTTLADYLTPHPHWKTVVDFDALGQKDHKSWVDAGIPSLYPGNSLCLVGLSDGGEDAHIYREFNLRSGQFVKGGFELPRAKSDVSWLDANHLVVDSEWTKGDVTESGYPYIVKMWKRGTPLSAAKEIFRGTKKDVAAHGFVLNDGQGHRYTFIGRDRTFFESDQYLWTPRKTSKMAIPAKTGIDGLLDDQLIITINDDWTPTGSKRMYPKGSVLALDMAAVKKDSLHLNPSVVFTPTRTEFVQRVDFTKNKLLLVTLNNVQGRAYACSFGSRGRWNRSRLPLGDNLAISSTSTNQSDDKFFLEVAGFITPPSIYLGDASTGVLKSVKSRKAQFDASDLKVEQLWATSKDGTKVPYFVVHKKSIKYDGSDPTLLDAYGGFQISITPYYSGGRGKLWLERGGIFVEANIRGGGEFGPAWHDAGLKTHRQRIYDDFDAVGQDLVARKITSTRRLGIIGGSNGGLLMGVEMTQHPEMWNAIVIQVPLLDMLGFEHIAAGASWVGEYGSISVPAERKFLASISPYNQLSPGVTYPEPLIFTTTKDDRVGPVHARKFAARMEEFGKPFFYDEIIEGGHSGGADLKQQAHTLATTFIYLIRKLMD